MDKVWIILTIYDDGTTDVVGVFASAEGAKEAEESLIRLDICKTRIVEFAVEP